MTSKDVVLVVKQITGSVPWARKKAGREKQRKITAWGTATNNTVAIGSRELRALGKREFLAKTKESSARAPAAYYSTHGLTSSQVRGAH